MMSRGYWEARIKFITAVNIKIETESCVSLNVVVQSACARIRR